MGVPFDAVTGTLVAWPAWFSGTGLPNAVNTPPGFLTKNCTIPTVTGWPADVTVAVASTSWP
jgi:hypothetical protein